MTWIALLICSGYMTMVCSAASGIRWTPLVSIRWRRWWSAILVQWPNTLHADRDAAFLEQQWDWTDCCWCHRYKCVDCSVFASAPTRSNMSFHSPPRRGSRRRRRREQHGCVMLHIHKENSILLHVWPSSLTKEEGPPVFSRKCLKWTVPVFVLVQGRLQLVHSSVFFLYFSSQVSLISSFVCLVACIDVWLIRLWIHNDAHYAPLWFLICFVSPFSSHLISLYAWYSFSARSREMQHF